LRSKSPEYEFLSTEGRTLSSPRNPVEATLSSFRLPGNCRISLACPYSSSSSPEPHNLRQMAATAGKEAIAHGAKAKAPTYPPNQTLYITNLPSSKIQKSNLRISLYALFSTYGPVLDVVALRTMKMRGQAHIVFRDIQTATQAMRALQGFELFGYEMVSSIILAFPVLSHLDAQSTD
jgi:hypothetical protein